MTFSDTPHFYRKKAFLGLLILGVLALIMAGLELTNTINLFGAKTEPSSGSQYTKGEGSGNAAGTVEKASDAPKDSSITESGSEPGDQKSSSGGGNTVSLLSPTGDFVSAHRVSANSALVSVCNTTPGASCTVTFTSENGVKKSLPVRTTDRGGSAYWDGWTPQEIGITTGSWQIKAVATLGDTSKDTSDALKLEVGQ